LEGRRITCLYRRRKGETPGADSLGYGLFARLLFKAHAHPLTSPSISVGRQSLVDLVPCIRVLFMHLVILHGADWSSQRRALMLAMPDDNQAPLFTRLAILQEPLP
jgi:hypothetical protein